MTQPIKDRVAKRRIGPTSRWNRFEVAWQQPILRQRLCRDLWTALTEAEREQAIVAAQGYVAWRNAQRKPPNPVNAERFLRERDAWARFAALAPSRSKPAAPPPRTRIECDSAEYIALQLARSIAGMPPPAHHDQGIEFVGEIPHGAHGMAMLANDPTQWVIRKKDTREFTAWCERVKEWTGGGLSQSATGSTSRAMSSRPLLKPSSRRGALVPRAIDGLRVPATPSGFPPPKSGDPPREENESAA
jgi:hypothetical protein